MGLGKSFKKAWKKTLGWADDAWVKDYALPIAATVVGGYAGAAIAGALGASSAVVSGATIAGASAGGSTYQGARSSHLQEKAQKRELQQMQDIANRQAAAAAVPVATSTAAQQTVSADTADVNYATERRRAMSMADTRTSQRLQRWAKNGKRRTL